MHFIIQFYFIKLCSKIHVYKYIYIFLVVLFTLFLHQINKTFSIYNHLKQLNSHNNFFELM